MPAAALVQDGIVIIIFGDAIADLAGTAILDIMLSRSAFQAARQSGSSGRKKQAGDSFGVVGVAVLAAEAVLTGMTVVASSAATISIFFIDFPWTNPR